MQKTKTYLSYISYFSIAHTSISNNRFNPISIYIFYYDLYVISYDAYFISDYFISAMMTMIILVDTVCLSIILFILYSQYHLLIIL